MKRKDWGSIAGTNLNTEGTKAVNASRRAGRLFPTVYPYISVCPRLFLQTKLTWRSQF